MRIVLLTLCLAFVIPAVMAQPDTAWVRRYDGTDNYWDEAHAIAVDASGNVYVCDRYNHRIQKFDEDLETHQSIGNRSSATVPLMLCFLRDV